jgi:glyoxylase-like metal-dependent hydrolase (beta-lactamase superfamily II)
MLLHQLKVGFMGNFAYLIGDEATKKAAIVDPSFGARELVALAKDEGLDIDYIFINHNHMDHVREAPRARELTGAEVVAHESSGANPDIPVNDDDTIQLGETVIRIIHTPGHTPDSICILADGKLMTGDTLFVGECGRTDLAGGDSRVLYRTLFEKLVKLDDDIEVWPGHDYGPKPHSTIGHEKMTNYVLEPRTEDEFVQFMLEP